MNAKRLREQVVKRRKELKRSDSGNFPDRTWQYLEARGYVEDALQQGFDEDAVELIVREIDDLAAAAPYGGSRRSARNDEQDPGGMDETQEELTPDAGEYVRARANAISEFLAVLADGRSDVIEFRHRALGGRSLAPKEARAFMEAPGGMPADLREIGGRLATDYTGWDEEGAVWYVLTGEAPRLRPVRIRARGRFPRHYRPFQHEVTLSVLPWVPAKEVKRVYRTVQQQLLEEKPRETGPRILEVAQFCWKQYRRRGPMASWRAWCEIWNETHPAKRFEKWRNFREYHLRGSREAIPTYKLPEPKPSAEKQQEIHAAQEHIIRALEGYMGKHGDRFIEATFE